jgi:uncharacterized protein YbaP (TraB family)
MCAFFDALPQTVFQINNFKGEQKGLLIGVFHSGIKIDDEFKLFLINESKKASTFIIEQNPIGGWSPELAASVLKIHSISTSELIKNENLKCMAEAEKQATKIGEGYAALFTSGPAAYLLMNVKPRYKDIPPSFSKANITVEKLLFDNFRSQGKKIEFLEEHVDPFSFLKEFTAKELGLIAEKHCNYAIVGDLDQKFFMLNVSSLANAYEAGNFEKLRNEHKASFSAIGWNEKLLINQYEKREKNFAQKILTKLKKDDGLVIATVGAAHIGGDTGLLAILRKSEFKIQECNFRNMKICK